MISVVDVFCKFFLTLFSSPLERPGEATSKLSALHRRTYQNGNFP